MLSLEKAKRPTPTNTSRPSRIIGRRVSPKVSRPLITGYLANLLRRSVVETSAPSRVEGIAEEQRALGGNELADLQAVGDLPVAVALQADLHRPLGEPTAVGGDPHRHRAVALPHHAVERNRDGAHRIAGANHEVRKHAGAQFVARIADFGTHEYPTGARVDDRADRGDLPVEHAVRKGDGLDLDPLP